MVGAVNGNAANLLRPDNGAVRERPDIARNSAASDANRNSAQDRQTLAEPRQSNRSETVDQAALERRVEARQAAEDSRLERFRSDELPLASARALEAFANVAGQRDGQDVELAGIDIRI